MKAPQPPLPSDFIAYAIDSGSPALQIVTAPGGRQWMSFTRERYAYRCLPLLIANQAGWFLLNPLEICVTWNGGPRNEDISIKYPSPQPPPQPHVTSHFGHGIITWTIPYLFRTPPGFNLLVRGPSNYPKDGAYPLEGLVEADWSISTFTMNWLITAHDVPITFHVNEPICMVVPQRRGDLEILNPSIQNISSESSIFTEMQRWADSRKKFLEEMVVPDTAAWKTEWQKDYFRGTMPSGAAFPEHAQKLKLKEFTNAERSISERENI